MSDDPWEGSNGDGESDQGDEAGGEDEWEYGWTEESDGADENASSVPGDVSADVEGRQDRGTPEAGIGSQFAPWETDAGTGGVGRAFVEVVVTVVLSFALAFALVVAGFFALLLVVSGEPSTVQTLLVSLLGSQAGLAIGGLSYLRWRREPIRNIGITVPGFKGVILVVVGTFATLVLAIAVGLLVQTLGLSAAENATAGEAAEVPSSLLLLIPIAIFVIGPAEELLFRGVVQRRLREVASAPVAIVVASALFAAAHVVALVGNPAAVATTIGILFVPALVFGVLYEYTKNVVVTALVHGLYDAVLFGLLYIAATFGPENADGGQALLDPQWVVSVLGAII